MTKTTCTDLSNQRASNSWSLLLAKFLFPILVGISILEWSLFFQHIHWDIKNFMMDIILFSLTLAKFGLVLARYIDGQKGASFREKAVQVSWACSSLPLIFYMHLSF